MFFFYWLSCLFFFTFDSLECSQKSLFAIFVWFRIWDFAFCRMNHVSRMRLFFA